MFRSGSKKSKKGKKKRPVQLDLKWKQKGKKGKKGKKAFFCFFCPSCPFCFLPGSLQKPPHRDI